MQQGQRERGWNLRQEPPFSVEWKHEEVCQGRAEATVKMRREHQAAARLFGNFFLSYSLVWFIGFILCFFFLYLKLDELQ